MRVLKRAVDPQGEESHTVYLFAGLELRRTIWDEALDNGNGDYELSADTEVAYLFANGVRLARVVYEQPQDGEPRIGNNPQHVFFELGDHLGSSTVVLDMATSELVERSTYQAYGGAESDYRPERWKGFREDYRFTGKEEDVEVGLQYFGFRYYSPLCGRWASADPSQVHGLADDSNVYAYVGGDALASVDPTGLGKTKALIAAFDAVGDIIRKSGGKINGKGLRGAKAFKGKRVTTADIKAHWNKKKRLVEASTKNAMRRVNRKFQGLKVPYNDVGMIDFERATYVGKGKKGQRAVVAKVRSGTDQGIYLKGGFSGSRHVDETKAWTALAKELGFGDSAKARKAVKKKYKGYTLHHDYINGRMVLVDRDVHAVYPHTAGHSLKQAGFYDSIGDMAGQMVGALFPLTTGDPNGFDVRKAFIDTFLLATPFGDAWDAEQFVEESVWPAIRDTWMEKTRNMTDSKGNTLHDSVWKLLPVPKR